MKFKLLAVVGLAAGALTFATPAFAATSGGPGNPYTPPTPSSTYQPGGSYDPGSQGDHDSQGDHGNRCDNDHGNLWGSRDCDNQCDRHMFGNPWFLWGCLPQPCFPFLFGQGNQWNQRDRDHCPAPRPPVKICIPKVVTFNWPRHATWLTETSGPALHNGELANYDGHEYVIENVSGSHFNVENFGGPAIPVVNYGPGIWGGQAYLACKSL